MIRKLFSGMSKAILFIGVIAIAACACKKSNSSTTYMNIAKITGPNLTMTACGELYMITIHGVTDSMGQFDSLPSGSGINLSTATFPVNVKINWHRNTGDLCDTALNYIIIDNVTLAD